MLYEGKRDRWRLPNASILLRVALGLLAGTVACVALARLPEASLWVSKDVLIAAAFLMSLACFGMFTAWVHVAAKSGNPVATYLEKWRRALAIEPDDERAT